MRLHEILTDAKLSSFIDKWYSAHAEVSKEEVNKLLQLYPDCSYSGAVWRVIEVHPEDVRKYFIDNEFDGDFEVDKVNEYIAKNEPNRYVSGCASMNGLDVFRSIGGTDPDKFVQLIMIYEVQNGLNLGKLAKKINSSKANQIQKIEEVLFLPKNGELDTWDTTALKA